MKVRGRVREHTERTKNSKSSIIPGIDFSEIEGSNEVIRRYLPKKRRMFRAVLQRLGGMWSSGSSALKYHGVSLPPCLCRPVSLSLFARLSVLLYSRGIFLALRRSTRSFRLSSRLQLLLPERIDKFRWYYFKVKLVAWRFQKRNLYALISRRLEKMKILQIEDGELMRHWTQGEALILQEHTELEESLRMVSKQRKIVGRNGITSQSS